MHICHVGMSYIKIYGCMRIHIHVSIMVYVNTHAVRGIYLMHFAIVATWPDGLDSWDQLSCVTYGSLIINRGENTISQLH